MTEHSQSYPDKAEALKQPQYIIEGIILRRLHQKRIEGYTLQMSKEIAAALSLGVAQTAWQPIETAPKDKELLLGWYRTWPEPSWEVAAGLAGSTKGGWLHGQATHWMPQPGPPLPSTTLATLPGHDETMANLDALTILSPESK